MLKDRFLKPEKLQNHSKKGKGKEKKERVRRTKGGKEKNTMVALFVFIIATYFGDSFWPEKTVRRKRSILQ